MSDLRRELLDTSDAPPDLSPDLRFLASRQAALAALLQDHADRYTALYTAARDTGPTLEIRHAALQSAGNLATLLQSLRSREELQVALAHAPGFVPTPLLAIDQLFYSFTLLAAATETPDDVLEAALTPAGVTELLQANRVQDWLRGLTETRPDRMNQ
ncbi:MAG TPA: hypothetical protein VMF14_20280 [Solirubrobacteraceae bacterium]|nr:hypothetical protein [Solirubrobacteraceae bacterium]